MIDRRHFSQAVSLWFVALPLTLATLTLSGCGKKDEGRETESGNQPAANQEISLSGAGATFPFPLYSKWMSEYNKLHPNVRINYNSIGSGGGIRQITAGTVDFGASDAPMSDSDGKKASGTLHHLPTTIGAVVVAYNVPGATSKLKLDSQLLAEVFLGKITKWNDPKLVAANPDAKLPALGITVVYRTDGSGTTAVFTDYLGTVSSEWKSSVGVGKAVKWPVGLGAKGNEGVTGQLKTTPGAVGYIELAYATQNKLTTASLKNKAGNYVDASSQAGTAAALGRLMPPSLFVSLADADGADAYPIASYTYLLIYQDAKDRVKGEALASFLWWAVHDGQRYAAGLDYAPLPPTVVLQLEERIKGLTFQGRKLLEIP